MLPYIHSYDPYAAFSLESRSVIHPLVLPFAIGEGRHMHVAPGCHLHLWQASSCTLCAI